MQRATKSSDDARSKTRIGVREGFLDESTSDILTNEYAQTIILNSLSGSKIGSTHELLD